MTKPSFDTVNAVVTMIALFVAALVPSARWYPVAAQTGFVVGMLAGKFWIKK